MKHALFVTFQYPPDASSSGVLRTLKYTRYLGDHGWRVTVLGPEVSAYDSVDAASLAQIPPAVNVVRTRHLNTRTHLSVRGRYLALTALPDRYIGWMPWAVAAGRRVAVSDPIDLIYSTSPPATTHLIARRLAIRLNRPWVADFRDPWYEDVAEAGAPSGRLFRAIDRALEARVVSGASHVVTTTPAMRDMLLSRYPALPRQKFGVIPNGYDEQDFADLPTHGHRATDRFTVVHAGGINAEFRDPAPLFVAVRRAAEAGLLDPQRLLLRFLGGGAYAESNELRQAIAANGLTDSVEIVGRLPYAQGLRELAAADALLLLQASDDTRGLVPAKLYEYLRLRKPVLALTLPGEVAGLIDEVGAGFAVDPSNLTQLVPALGTLYRAWQAGELDSWQPAADAVGRYERRTLAGELATVFGRLTGADAR